ncbi:MAG: hypothetical protein OEY64_13255, partial [Nitrospinota bacterium]|nr:hypothetical protein [Nitrospinota bacterium]
SKTFSIYLINAGNRALRARRRLKPTPPGVVAPQGQKLFFHISHQRRKLRPSVASQAKAYATRNDCPAGAKTLIPDISSMQETAPFERTAG